jgi:hypothetical protein
MNCIHSHQVVRNVVNLLAYRTVHINHLAQRSQFEPRSMGVMARNPRRHHESERKRGQATNSPISVRVLFEEVSLVGHLFHERWIF